ncbi:unnamed protein product [Euphydryas editha]|nr:unnamed protein product [Euphydryas editha]
MPNLGFEEKINKVVLIIARKKYTILQSGPLVTTPETIPSFYRNSWIDVGDLHISHNGYERNALEPIKYICNVVAGLTFLNFTGQRLGGGGGGGGGGVKSLDRCIEGIYTYMYRELKKTDLYINIPLKRLKPNSVRKMFIEKYATNYQGSVNAVFVVNASDKTKEELLLFDDYCFDPSKYHLHYGFFFAQLPQDLDRSATVCGRGGGGRECRHGQRDTKTFAARYVSKMVRKYDRTGTRRRRKPHVQMLEHKKVVRGLSHFVKLSHHSFGTVYININKCIDCAASK